LANAESSCQRGLSMANLNQSLKEIKMTNKKALDIVLAMARELNIDGNRATSGIGEQEIEALAQMEDYYNDVLED
jgi:hypothetical protein